MGPPPDHRRANRRAHRQLRTDVTDTNRRPLLQPRTIVADANRGNISSITHKNKLYMGTYNTRTINDLNLDSRDVMLHELKSMKWDIIGLSETKIKDSEIETITDNHRLYSSGNGNSRSNGVGFLVHKRLIPSITDYRGISDRLALLTVEGKNNKITIVQVYFPTSNSPDEEVDNIYDQIQLIIDNTPKRDFLVLMGDFNAKVGGLHSMYPTCIGKHTIGESNARGVLLANFCLRNKLAITNTNFQKRKLHTWTSPDGKTKNQIDFILVRTTHKYNVSDVSALNTPDISDHRMVRACLNTNFVWQKAARSPVKYNISALKNIEKAKAFQLELSNRFQPLLNNDDHTDVDSLSENIISEIISSAKAVIPPKKDRHPEWMSNESKTAIENKKIIRSTYGDSAIQYKIAKAEAKMLVKKDKIHKLERDCEELSQLPPNKQFFLAMKELKTKKRTISWGIEGKDGTVLTNKDEILERWAGFYEELYDDTPPTIQPKTNLDIPPITLFEVEESIIKLKKGKSTGLDNICAEFLQCGGDSTTKVLLKLFNNILTTGHTPMSFKRALIVIIFKKGIRTKCKNYRPISLLSHIYKLFITIIASRIKNDLYHCFPSSQAAYQPGRGTIEQIFSLQQIIEKSIEFNNPVHLVFIDFTKAFDSVHLSSLWKILETSPIQKDYITLLKSTYEGSQSAIKTDIGTSRLIDIMKGVKQGDILSAILFCVVLAAVILKTEEENSTGFSIGGQIISNLSYADDIAAINTDINELQDFINRLAANAKEVGLEINLDKTECMTTDKTQQSLGITIYDKPIKQVSEFVYLGHKLSAIYKNEAAVDYRIALAWAAFSKKEHILKSNRVTIKVKTKIYNTYVVPVLLYGLDCVTWTSRMMSKFEVFQNHIMRFITGKRLIDKVKIKTLQEITQLQPITNKIKSISLKLFGHIKRSTCGLSKICLEGMIPGKRNRGRPHGRWRDQILKWSQCQSWQELNKMPSDREKWRKHVHVVSYSAVGGNSDI